MSSSMEAEEKFHVTLHAVLLPMTGTMHSSIFLFPQEYSKSMLQRHVATKPPYCNMRYVLSNFQSPS